MSFEKLPNNSRIILQQINRADNPAEMLSNMFDNCSTKEEEELRSILSELREKGYLTIKWASNKPYIVNISNSARTYEERLREYDIEKSKMTNIEVNIGNNNHFKGTPINIANHNFGECKTESMKFYEKHPITCAFLISIIAGFVLMFKFWGDIVMFIEKIFTWIIYK